MASGSPRSLFLCLLSIGILTKSRKEMNIRPANAPAKVPVTPPAAPYAAIFIEAEWAFANAKAAHTLMMPFTTCSKSCDIAVGTIVPLPWKNPLTTPRTAETNTVGASALRGIWIAGLANIWVDIKPAPK